MVKTYSVDSEVLYTDEGSTDYTSDNIPVLIDVQADPTPGIAGAVLAILIIAGGAYLWYRRKKTKESQGKTP
jgi:LPXTG-motif cell wall-anchored protein